jgi:hypothetical protein
MATKVMCIKSSLGWQIAARWVGGTFPDVGDECTVKRKYTCTCGKHEVYDFEEHNELGGFDARNFAILPESDADEINSAEHEAIIPPPTKS